MSFRSSTGYILAAVLATTCSCISPPLPLTPGLTTTTGVLQPGGQASYQVESIACSGNSILNAELWETSWAIDPEKAANADAGANAILFMAQKTRPKATPPRDPDNNPDWTFSPYNAVAYDYVGYQLKRPYQRIRQTHNPACTFPACTDPWYIEVVNPQSYGGYNLSYQLRVTCQLASDPQGCPSPALALGPPHAPKGQCSDQGQCKVFDSVCTDAAFSQGECTFCECEVGWGDVGCSVPVPDLPLEAEQQHSTKPGQWSYFNIALDSHPPDGTLLLELNRTGDPSAGDPVLFLKRHDEGFARNGLPASQDYDLFADGTSYEERLNYHSITRIRARNAGYYVGVFNNGKYLVEDAKYSLRARWVQQGSLLCPWDCHGGGKCTDILGQPTCVCYDGFGGLFCEGTQQQVSFGRQAFGSVAPGQWTYLTLTIDRHDPTWRGGLAVAFLTSKTGHAVVLQKYSSVPTFLDNDRVLRAKQEASGVESIRLTGDELHPGTIFFAFFNVDYFVHQKYSFVFLVVPVVPQGGSDVNAYISLCLGVTLSFSAAMSLVLLWRWAHQRGQEGLPTLAPGRTTTGIEPDTVASFPTYRYQGQEGYSVAARAASTRYTKPGEAGDFEELLISRGRSEPALPSPKLGAATVSDPIKVFEGPSCAVCLGDYEDGEMIRQLPDCHHHFHMECIDQWLATHTTCPMCRRSLLPPAEAAVSPASPSGSPSAHLLPLWSSSTPEQPELSVELGPLDVHRRTEDPSQESLDAEGSTTALLNDSSRDIHTSSHRQ